MLELVAGQQLCSEGLVLVPHHSTETTTIARAVCLHMFLFIQQLHYFILFIGQLLKMGEFYFLFKCFNFPHCL